MSLSTVANGPLAIAGSILSLDKNSGNKTAITLAIIIVKNIDTPNTNPKLNDCSINTPNK